MWARLSPIITAVGFVGVFVFLVRFLVIQIRLLLHFAAVHRANNGPKPSRDIPPATPTGGDRALARDHDLSLFLLYTLRWTGERNPAGEIEYVSPDAEYRISPFGTSGGGWDLSRRMINGLDYTNVDMGNSLDDLKVALRHKGLYSIARAATK